MRDSNYEGYYASVFYSYFAALGLDVTVEDSTSHGTPFHSGKWCSTRARGCWCGGRARSPDLYECAAAGGLQGVRARGSCGSPFGVGPAVEELFDERGCVRSGPLAPGDQSGRSPPRMRAVKVVEMEPEGAAMAQLREKDYAAKYRGGSGEVFLVGVEFSRNGCERDPALDVLDCGFRGGV